MTTFVYDEYHHITGFEMLWPDGTYKPSFLLTSVAQLSGREIAPEELRRFRFRESTDFMVVGASELPDTLLRHVRVCGAAVPS
jgi:hypothetical protein